VPERKIILGVTGSIAAYKSVILLRLLQKQGFDVHVVMTESATKFVAPLTFKSLSKHPVALDMFDENINWATKHISLAENADVFVVAPCTANTAAKIAHGIADNILTCTALSVECPVVIAPAMNFRMWANKATEDNMAILKKRGVTVIKVTDGELACGEEGSGRMAEPEIILDVILKTIQKRRKLK